MDKPVGLAEGGGQSDRYRLLVDAITDYAIYMLDPTGIVTSWNAGAERCKGYRAEEVLGRHFSEFYTEEDRLAGEPAHALSVAAAEGRFEREGWRVRKDGARFWAHVIIDPIPGENGQVVGFAKITRDLTEKRRTEEALRAQRAAVPPAGPGGDRLRLYMLDPQGFVSSWNAGARDQGLRAGRDHRPAFLPLLFRGGSGRRPAGASLEIARREGRFETEGWRVRKDGSRFWATSSSMRSATISAR